jgi:hypothetical protein
MSQAVASDLMAAPNRFANSSAHLTRGLRWEKKTRLEPELVMQVECIVQVPLDISRRMHGMRVHVVRYEDRDILHGFAPLARMIPAV